MERFWKLWKGKFRFAVRNGPWTIGEDASRVYNETRGLGKASSGSGTSLHRETVSYTGGKGDSGTDRENYSQTGTRTRTSSTGNG